MAEWKIKTVFIIGVVLLSIQWTASVRAQSINLEIDLVQPLFGGIGGTIGMENGHWGYGLMAFSTPLNDMSKEFIFSEIGDYDVDNQGVEIYSHYYFDSNHLGFFMGGLVSYDTYELSLDDEHVDTVFATYLAPELGYRFGLGTHTFWQAALAIPIMVFDDADKVDKDEDGKKVELNPVLTLPLLTLGVKF